MNTASLFRSGRSQAVRLPKKFRFEGTKVSIEPFGNGVLLLPASNPWQTLQADLDAFEPGFRPAREQPMETHPTPSTRQTARPVDWASFFSSGMKASADFMSASERMPIQKRSAQPKGE